MRDDKLIEAMARAIAGSPYYITDTEWEQVRADESEYLMRIAEAKMALAAAEAAGYQLVSRDRLAAIWSAGYIEGHSDGIGCGHPLARMCQHSGDESAADNAEEIAMLAAAPEAGRD